MFWADGAVERGVNEWQKGRRKECTTKQYFGNCEGESSYSPTKRNSTEGNTVQGNETRNLEDLFFDKVKEIWPDRNKAEMGCYGPSADGHLVG